MIITTTQQTFAEWGVDMLKMDGCAYSDLHSMPQGYMNVSNYLNGTGRHIVFSCSWPAYWNEAGMKVACASDTNDSRFTDIIFFTDRLYLCC